MTGGIAIFVAVAILAALAASRGRGLALFFWSLLFSSGVLVAGAVPFYSLEKIAETPGQGAPFVLLLWMMVGPPLSFVLLPVSYAASDWLKLGRNSKLYLVPAILSGLVTAAAFALSASAEGQLQLAVVALIPFSAVVFAAWIPYCLALDWARSR